MKHLLTILFIFTFIGVQAQFKTSSIGLRLGGVSGVSYKYIDDDFKGFELILGAREGGLRFTGLLQKYKPVATNRIAGFSFFAGGGAHVGYAKYTENIYRIDEGVTYYSYYEKTNPVLGGDFILGAEYHFETIPLHLTLDYKPYFELFGEKTLRVDLWDIGFSIRYSFNT